MYHTFIDKKQNIENFKFTLNQILLVLFEIIF